MAHNIAVNINVAAEPIAKKLTSQVMKVRRKKRPYSYPSTPEEASALRRSLDSSINAQPSGGG